MSKFGCCEWLVSMLSARGEKGFSVIPVKEHGGRYFALQARPIDDGTLSALRRSTPTERPPMRLASILEIGISFCPSCGTNLDTVIEEHITSFDTKADEARRFRVDG